MSVKFLQVTVGAGEVCAENSRVYGPGMSAIGLGRPAKVFIDIQDGLGNKVHCNNAEHEGIKVSHLEAHDVNELCIPSCLTL